MNSFHINISGSHKLGYKIQSKLSFKVRMAYVIVNMNELLNQTNCRM